MTSTITMNRANNLNVCLQDLATVIEDGQVSNDVSQSINAAHDKLNELECIARASLDIGAMTILDTAKEALKKIESFQGRLIEQKTSEIELGVAEIFQNATSLKNLQKDIKPFVRQAKQIKTPHSQDFLNSLETRKMTLVNRLFDIGMNSLTGNLTQDFDQVFNVYEEIYDFKKRASSEYAPQLNKLLNQLEARLNDFIALQQERGGRRAAEAMSQRLKKLSQPETVIPQTPVKEKLSKEVIANRKDNANAPLLKMPDEILKLILEYVMPMGDARLACRQFEMVMRTINTDRWNAMRKSTPGCLGIPLRMKAIKIVMTDGCQDQALCHFNRLARKIAPIAKTMGRPLKGESVTLGKTYEKLELKLVEKFAQLLRNEYGPLGQRRAAALRALPDRLIPLNAVLTPELIRAIEDIPFTETENGLLRALDALPAEIQALHEDVVYGVRAARVGELQQLVNLFPDIINGFEQNLEGLNAHRIPGFPKSLTLLKIWLQNPTNVATITALGLGFSKLPVLPNLLGQLTALRSLLLDGNNIANLPNELEQLTALETLSLAYNKLTKLPEAVLKLHALQSFCLDNNPIETLPEEIGLMTSLQELSLNETNIRTIPDKMALLRELQKLNLYGTKIKEVPEWIGEFPALQTLNLAGTRITGLPKSITQLRTLTDLELFGTRIKKLPEWIGEFLALTSLNISDTPLEELPESIGQLRTLLRLLVDDTRIKKLPESIGDLPALQRLDLSDTNLESVPASLARLMTLTNLDLKGVKLTHVPEAVIYAENQVISKNSVITAFVKRTSPLARLYRTLDRQQSGTSNCFSKVLEKSDRDLIRNHMAKIMNKDAAWVKQHALDKEYRETLKGAVKAAIIKKYESLSPEKKQKVKEKLPNPREDVAKLADVMKKLK